MDGVGYELTDNGQISTKLAKLRFLPAVFGLVGKVDGEPMMRLWRSRGRSSSSSW